VIVVNLRGGLGNQMFQYALGLNLSRRLEVPLKLDLRFLRDRTPRPGFVFRDYELDVFGIAPVEASAQELWRFGVGMSNLAVREKLLSAQRLVHFLPGVYRERTFAFDPLVLTLESPAYLDGYWQCEPYFEGVAPDVARLFLPVQPGSGPASRMLSKIGAERGVCLNVRRGDFVNHPLHGTTDLTYFTTAVARMRELVGDFTLFVFSDDVPWCRENLRLVARQVFVDHDCAGPKFYHYLALMAACHHFIIPNSSFAWWAAWLGRHVDKKIIAPKRWFADPSIDTRDVTPPTWIRL
jgi:hypothetical protein